MIILLDEERGPIWDTTCHAPRRPQTWVPSNWTLMGGQPNVQVATLRQGTFRNDERGRCWRLLEGIIPVTTSPRIEVRF